MMALTAARLDGTQATAFEEYPQRVEALAMAPAPTEGAAAGDSALTRPTVRERVATSGEVVRASRRLHSNDLIRMRGDFGFFQGHASTITPAGFAGLRADPSEQYRVTAPEGVLTWDRIDYVDKRGGSAGRGAAIGAVSLGLISATAAASLFAAFDGTTNDALGAAVAVGVTGALVGGLLGALIGAGVPAWHNVYGGH